MTMKALGWAVGALALAGMAAPANALDVRVILGDGDDRYGDNRYYRDPGRIAYDEGFRDGVDKGERDGRKGDRFNPWRHGDYRDADDGYHREFGSKYSYQRTYRRAFEAGYRRAFANYSYRYGYGREGYRDRGDYGRDGSYGRDGYYDDDRYRDRDRYDDRYRHDD
jgi:hypothetical protein